MFAKELQISSQKIDSCNSKELLRAQSEDQRENNHPRILKVINSLRAELTISFYYAKMNVI